MVVSIQHLSKEEEIAFFESVRFSPCRDCSTPSLCVIIEYELLTDASRMISATFFWSAATVRVASPGKWST